MEKWITIWAGMFVVLMFGPLTASMCEDHAREKSRLAFCERTAQNVEAYKECIKK